MIQTTRCELTAPLPADLDLILKLDRDAEVRRFLGGVVDEKEIRLRFLTMLNECIDTHYWIIKVKENSSVGGIGIVSLNRHHNNIDTEISYRLLPEWWHRGYTAEAVEAVVNYALTVLSLPRVIAETQIANIASCRLLERIGMHLERTIERFGAKQGIFTT